MTAPCRLDANGWCLAHWHYRPTPCPYAPGDRPVTIVRPLRHHPVTCRFCRRTSLRGWRLPTGEWMVKFHYRPDGLPCGGHDFDVHHPDRPTAAA